MRHALSVRLGIAGFIAIVPFLIGADGCNAIPVKVVTRIEGDGRIYRETHLVRDQALPPEALAGPKKYPPSTQPADYPLRPEWAARWTESQPATAAPEQGPAEIAAAGTFASAADVPRTYHLVDWPLADRASTNRIEHVFTDYCLFGIDDWNETITETVLLSEYAETVDAMLQAMRPAFEATLDEVHGRQYDFLDLHLFLHDEAATAARRYALLRYQIACEPDGEEDSPESMRRYRDIAAGMGLNLPLNDQGEIDGEQAETAARQFVQNLLQTRVRSRSTGQCLTADQAKDLAKKLHLDFPPSTQPAATQPDSENQPAATAAAPPGSQPTEADAEPAPWNSKWQELFEKHFERIHGTKLEEAALRWGALTGGANRSGPIQFFDPYSPGSRAFNFTLECAGPIFETNGRLSADKAVRWDFGSSALWPNGYRMHAAAIRWNRSAEQRLFGRHVLAGFADALSLRDTIGNREPVKDALQKAIAEGTLDPLRDLAATDNDDGKAAREILSLATRPAP